MSALESLNPFFNYALVSEMRALRLAPDLLSAKLPDSALVLATGAGSATAPDLSDPPVAVAANSSSCGGVESRHAGLDAVPDMKAARCRSFQLPDKPKPNRAGVASCPQDSISVSAISAEGGVPAGEPPAPIAPVLVGTANPQLAEGPVVAPRQTESFAARSLGPGRKKDQASFEPTPQAPATPSPGVETTAGDTGETIVSSPAAFSLDVRIHNIMLAVADELADEQRTINERLLLRQFACQSRRA